PSRSTSVSRGRPGVVWLCTRALAMAAACGPTCPEAAHPERAPRLEPHRAQRTKRFCTRTNLVALRLIRCTVKCQLARRPEPRLWSRQRTANLGVADMRGRLKALVLLSLSLLRTLWRRARGERRPGLELFRENYADDGL